tara:strand:+ start:3935 stop:4126 length:192 start_codon:yes stop_codon:yes gene_type:complete
MGRGSNINTKLKMTTTTKDNIELIAANGGAIGLSLTEINDVLITISIILAICVSLVKLFRKRK